MNLARFKEEYKLGTKVWCLDYNSECDFEEPYEAVVYATHFDEPNDEHVMVEYPHNKDYSNLEPNDDEIVASYDEIKSITRHRMYAHQICNRAHADYLFFTNKRKAYDTYLQNNLNIQKAYEEQLYKFKKEYDRVNAKIINEGMN